MFKWFWTIFSLGAPVEYLQDIKKRALRESQLQPEPYSRKYWWLKIFLDSGEKNTS